MEFSPSNVEKVLEHFYSANFSVEANQWLIVAQQSNEAWQFAWSFLDRSKPDVVQFFGASTLCYKVMQHYRELTVERGIELRNGLMHKLLEFSQGPRGVLTKLCVSLAHVTFRLTPDEWPSPLASLIDFFSTMGGDGERSHLVLLEMLRVLPEEFYTAFLPAHRRAGVKAALQRDVELVMNLFESLLSSNSHPKEVYNGCIVACCSWLHFSVSFAERSALVQRFFAALNDPALFDTAVECLCNVFSHPDTLKYPATIEKMLPLVINLQPMLNRSIADEDHDTSAGLTRLLATLCESQCKLLLDLACRAESMRDGEEEGEILIPLSLVKMMLQCTNMPGHYPVDETVSEMALSFWYILQEDIVCSDESRCHRLVHLFTSTYSTLMHVLMGKAAYPDWETYQSKWSTDDKEKFRCYRQDIADTMMSSYSILREPFLNHIYDCLLAVRQRKLSGDRVPWQEVEALLFLLSAVAENINIEAESCVAYIFAIMNDIELDHPKAVETALEMISAFQEWMTCHPEVLASVIPPVLRCLHNADLRPSAAMCLRDLCNVNQEHLLPYVSHVLSALHQVLSHRGGSGQEDTRECAVLMSCVGYCLAMMLDRNQIQEYMGLLVNPEIEALKMLVAQPVHPQLQSPIRSRLMMLAYLFSSLQRSLEEDLEAGQGTQGPCVAIKQEKSLAAEIISGVLEGILPILELLTSKWIGDSVILESITELFRWTVRNTLVGFEPVVTQVAALVSNMYHARPQASLLDLAKQIVVWFSVGEKPRPLARHLLQSVSSRTMFFMRENEAQLRNVTDLIEAYMWLLHLVLRKCAPLLLEEAGIDEQARLAICGLGMPEQGTVKASCHFLAELIKTQRSREQQLIENLGLPLNDRLLRCIAGESPRQVIEFMAEVYQSLNQHYPAQQRRWLTELLITRKDYPSVRVSREEKQKFIGILLTSRASKRILKDAIRNFSMKCLGLVTAQQTLTTVSVDSFDCAIQSL